MIEAVACVHCGRVSHHDSDSAPRETHCPHCRGGVIVPAAVPEDSRREICFRCDAAVSYQPSRSPKWVRCPRCGNNIRVPGFDDGKIDE